MNRNLQYWVIDGVEVIQSREYSFSLILISGLRLPGSGCVHPLTSHPNGYPAMFGPKDTVLPLLGLWKDLAKNATKI